MTWFALENNCADFLMYVTPSRSRPIAHNVVVCKRTGHVSCDCEDSIYRLKSGDLLDPTPPHACWHVKQYCATVGKIVAMALGRVA